ncbi:ABC transporter permease [Ornithinimicrobium cerasi]|uniref:Transport permease protein n=1 Tax=Ornithinimicrobium cerasi TaxID=2248773 RepID=A0A285VF29_9MICO|nr:ABC transporter permease [Ornithinimicrobium cerasi]SOC52679.1 lipooligosaccharide transport system permease protein [Ornithinimicrobium cerasi]
MTEPQTRAGGVELDTNRLAYSGRAPSHAVMAERARRLGVWYYAETTLRGMRAYFWPILFYSVGQPLLYMIAMGVGLGTLVTRGVGSVDGVDYLTFVAPALLVSTVVMSVSGELTYPVMGGFKWHRLYYGPLASAVSPGQIALGHLLAVVIRFVLQSAIFWAVMVAFGATPSGWSTSLLVIPIGVLSATAFGAPLQAYAASVKDEGLQFAFIQRFLVMPMFLFAGTFFPLSVMPVYLQWIGWISPVWHGTQLARLATYGADVPLPMVLLHLSVLVGLTVLGMVLAVRVYTRRLRS